MKVGLLVDDAEVEIIRSRIERQPWALGAFRRLKSTADAVFGWRGGTVGSTPRGSASAVEAAALVYRISGDEAYADAAGGILEGAGSFAELFGSISSDTFDFGCNTLFTGHQLPHLSIAFDLLWDELPAKVRDHVAEDLILPAVKHLRTNDRRDSNWQSAHSAGILSAGLVLEKKDLVSFALDDPDHGLRRHMSTSFLGDGLHWEGSFGYHFGTVGHILISAEMARHSGIDLYAEGDGTPYIKRMLDVAIQMAFPDRSLPINNDAGPMALDGVSQHFELGYARYADPAFGWVIEQTDRSSLYALVAGKETVDAVTPGSASVDLEQTGWTALKSVQGTDYWGSGTTVAVLDHGPHGDWHGHPDKLGLEVFADGLYWIRNDGSPVGYHNRQHWDYFRRTLSKNTVVVDHQDQDFERAGDDVLRDLDRTGTVEGLTLSDGAQRVAASVDWAYEGITYRRTVALDGAVVIDAFEVGADEEHTYDYILHGRGVVELSGLGAVRERLPQDTGGYEYFVNTACAQTDGPWCVIFKDGGWPDGRFVPTGKQLTISFEPEPGTGITIGYAPSRLRGVYSPFVLVRRTARNTVFRAALQPGEAA